MYGDGSYRYFCFGLDMVIDHFFKIHLIKLVAGEDEHVVKFMHSQVVQALPYRIRRTLEPRAACRRLLSCQYINKSLAEAAEMIGVFKYV
jgi:hypothetical protein